MTIQRNTAEQPASRTITVPQRVAIGDPRSGFEALLLQAVEVAVMATDLNGTITYWNGFAEKLYGWTAQEALGRSILDLIVVSAQPPENILAHLREGTSWSAEIVVRHRDGRVFPVEVTRSPVRDADGKLVAIVGVSADISHRRATQAALKSSEERLRVAQEAGRVGTFEWLIATGEVKVSPVFCQLWGIPRSTSVRVGLFDELVHPEDRDRLASARNRPLDEAVGYTEYRIHRRDTRALRWLARRGELMQDESGRATRVVGVLYDITDRKNAEAEQRLIAQESAHRIKNTLTMVQAIARQSLRRARSLPDAEAALTARLAALGSAHDVLTQDDRSEADLAAVVAKAVEAHNEDGRIRWEGDRIVVDSRAALALTLALHELCTNALKYGALSASAGSVSIAWTVETSGTESTLLFHWIERGGPPARAPARKGFGSRLIERGLADSLNGDVTMRYDEQGVRLTLSAPLPALEPRDNARPEAAAGS